MIKDMLFILKEICYLSLDKKDSKSSTNQNATDVDNDPNESAEMSSQMNASDSGPTTTRDKKRDAVPTMNEAVICLKHLFNNSNLLNSF